LDGFNVANVLICYGVIFFLTGLLFLYKKWYKKKYNKDYDERTVSIESEFTPKKFKVLSQDNLINK